MEAKTSEYKRGVRDCIAIVYREAVSAQRRAWGEGEAWDCLALLVMLRNGETPRDIVAAIASAEAATN